MRTSSSRRWIPASTRGSSPCLATGLFTRSLYLTIFKNILKSINHFPVYNPPIIFLYTVLQSSFCLQSINHLSVYNPSIIFQFTIHQTYFCLQSIKHLSVYNPSIFFLFTIHQSSFCLQSINHLSVYNPSIFFCYYPSIIFFVYNPLIIFVMFRLSMVCQRGQTAKNSCGIFLLELCQVVMVLNERYSIVESAVQMFLS
jgi:hypothetical protein